MRLVGDEAVLGLDPVELALNNPLDDGRKVMRANAEEADLALLFGDTLRLQVVIRNGGGTV